MLTIEPREQFSGGKAGSVEISAFQMVCEFSTIEELRVRSDANPGNIGHLLEVPAAGHGEGNGIGARRLLSGFFRQRKGGEHGFDARRTECPARLADSTNAAHLVSSGCKSFFPFAEHQDRPKVRCPVIVSRLV